MKARREAIWEEQVKIAAKEAEKRLKARSGAELKRLEKKTPGVASIINQLTKPTMMMHLLCQLVPTQNKDIA